MNLPRKNLRVEAKAPATLRAVQRRRIFRVEDRPARRGQCQKPPRQRIMNPEQRLLMKKAAGTIPGTQMRDRRIPPVQGRMIL